MNWIAFKTFVDSNNKPKTLIFPFKTQSQVNYTEAVRLCNEYNATTVEIETQEKQTIIVSFYINFIIIQIIIIFGQMVCETVLVIINGLTVD